MRGRTRGTRRALSGATAATTAMALVAVLVAACDSDDGRKAEAASATGSHATSSAHQLDVGKQLALYSALRQLWEQHMEWTYATVNAFFHDQKAVAPTLDRLLADQKDLGAAVVPYYGQAAGDQLTTLLTTHIKEAVPVLQAAKAGNKTQLDRALAAWYANAKQIADLLSAANPQNWPASATEPMLKEHISQTTTYSVDLLKGDYAAAITHYDLAEQHMLMLADVLAKGLVAQFPDRFR